MDDALSSTTVLRTLFFMWCDSRVWPDPVSICLLLSFFFDNLFLYYLASTALPY